MSALLNDQLSLWEVAHRWCNADPDDSSAIGQLKVRECLRKLALVTQHTLNLFNSKGEPDLDNFFPAVLRGESRSKLKDEIARCINERDYDPKVFDVAFVLKDEVEKWCRLNNYALPVFWFRDDEVAYYEKTRIGTWGKHPAIDFLTEEPMVAVLEPAEALPVAPGPSAPPPGKVTRLRPNQSDKLAIRAVAARLWESLPDLNIVEMIGRPEIKVACNGAQYADKTIREWIKDLDPRPADQRVGRPKRKQ